MFKKALCSLAILTLIAVTLIYVTGYGFLLTATYRVYFQGHTTANINDYKQFHTNVIKTSTPQPLPVHSAVNSKPLSDAFLQEVKTQKVAAFLVIQNGEIVSEHYFNGYTDRSKTNSFSMAKTVLTMLVGKAVEDGYIASFDQPITTLLPELKDDPLANKATLAHLSLMNSGYEWTENYYSPISPTVELLYGSDITDFLTKGEFSAEPGTFWEYSSASTELLGIALKRALLQHNASASLSEYLSETLWKPLGMNDDALWHLDNSDMELVFCCLNTNARNYAKLGMLMLDNGNWNGQQVLPEGLVEQMIQPLAQSYYGYSTWLGLEHDPAHYYMSGHLGQFVIVIPERNVVIVRLGESTSPEREMMEEEVPFLIKEGLGQLPN
jgi:CubicO group peptidase (beta-lactamase class C family)